MATYFVGMGIEAYAASPAGVQNNAAAVGFPGTADPYFADAIIRDPDTGLQIAPDAFWFHAFQYGNGSTSRDGILFFNDQGVAVLKCTPVSQAVQQIYILRDGAWVAVGTSVATDSAFTWDICLVAHATEGRLALNINSVSVFDLTGIDTSNLAGINRVRLQSAVNGNGSWVTWYTQVIIADYNTIGHTVRVRPITGPGPEQDWEGDYTAVSEAVLNDATAIATSTADASSTFVATDLSPTSAGSVIKCVAVAMRVRAGGEAPTKVSAVLTVAGVDYTSPPLAGSGGYGGASMCFDKNPASGSPWASIDAVNGNYGVKAIV